MSDKETIKWKSISKNVKLSETVVRKNQNRVYWPYIAQYQKFSTTFWTEFIDQVEEYDLWDLLAQYQDIGSDQDFIVDNAASFNWDILLKYNCITERYIADAMVKVQSVTAGPINFFYILKSDFPEHLDPYDTTSFEIFGNNVSANNKAFTLFAVAEDETRYGISSPTSYTTAGVTKIGYIKLIGTGSGESTSDFLDNVTIAPYLHESNSATKPFRKALYQGNTLAEQWIVDNDTYINFDYLSRYCPLSEHFIFNYDNNSTVTDANPSYDLHWDYLVINQDLKYTFSDEISWTESLINFYLALKYQNLSSSFILNNQDLFDLTEVGLFNKNLSAQDLEDIATANPWLEQTTARPDNIIFDYPKSDILADLKAQDFEIQEKYAIGYVKYLRSGSPPNEIHLDFSQPAGTIVSNKQLDLDQNNVSGRVGITVENGKNLLDDDRLTHKIAKIKTEIINRITNTQATGSILTPVKGLIENEDIIVIDDGDNEFWFEFVKLKTTKKPPRIKINKLMNRIEIEDPDHDFEHLDAVGYNDDYEGVFNIINEGDGYLYYGNGKYRAFKNIKNTLSTNIEKYFLSHTVDSLNRFLIATMKKLCVVSSTGTTDTNEDTITLNNTLRLDTGDPIRFTGTLPSPLSTGTTYYAVKVDDTTIKVATSIENAIANQVLDLTTSGSSYYVFRYDSTIVLLEDANLVTGQKINLFSEDVTYSSIPSGMSDTVDYYVYKIDDHKFKVAETKSDLETENFVSITSMAKDFFEIQTLNIPIYLGEDVKTASDVADILARIIENLQIHKVTYTEYNTFFDYHGQVDYRALKTIKSSLSATVTDYLTTATSIDLETNRIHLNDDVGIQTGDPVTFVCSSTYPIYSYIALPAQSVGTGLADLTSSGSYTGSSIVTYTIKISSAGTPDQFQYKKGAGSYSTAQDITGELQTIGDGIYIQFADTTGHTANDEFTIVAGRYLQASSSYETVYYAKRLSTDQIELYESLYDLERGNLINFVSTYAGTLTIYPCSVTIDGNIDFNTGDTVIFDASANLSTGLSDGYRYFVNKVSTNKFFLSSFQRGALNGIAQPLKSKGTGTFTLTFDDANIASDTSGGTGKIIGYNRNGTGTLFVEKITDSFLENDDLIIVPDPDASGVFASTTLTTSNLEATSSGNKISITNNRPISSASEGNNQIQNYTNYFVVDGMKNGYEDNIVDDQAKGIGVVLPIGKLHAFSVEIIDPDYFDELKY